MLDELDKQSLEDDDLEDQFGDLDTTSQIANRVLPLANHWTAE